MYRFLELSWLVKEFLALLKRPVNNLQRDSMIFDYSSQSSIFFLSHANGTR